MVCYSGMLLVCIGQIKASTSPLGIPRAFDTFAFPGRREFDYQSLPGGGEFDPHALGVGNLNCTLDIMWNLWRGELSWGMRWKRLCLCGQLDTRKGLKQALCRIWRYLNFNIFNVWFRLCNEIQYLYRRFNTTIKSSTDVNYFDLPHVC